MPPQRAKQQPRRKKPPPQEIPVEYRTMICREEDEPFYGGELYKSDSDDGGSGVNPSYFALGCNVLEEVDGVRDDGARDSGVRDETVEPVGRLDDNSQGDGFFACLGDLNEFFDNEEAEHFVPTGEEVSKCYVDDVEALEDLGPLELEFDDVNAPGCLLDVEEETDTGFDERLGELEDFELETHEIGGVDDSLQHYIRFNRRRHLQEPVLVPDMLFGSSDEFKSLMRSYAVATRKPLKYTKNEPWRVGAKCRVSGCEFFVWCSRLHGTKDLSIKTIKDEHTCGDAIKNKMATVKFLAAKYLNKIRRDPQMTLHQFIGTVNDELGLEISKCHASRVIKTATDLLYGNEKAQFAKLWSYADEIRLAMPGSTIQTQLANSVFERIYMCLEPLKTAFKNGLRKFICLDGCFLKGSFRGQLLAAVGCDGDNGIFPLAWAIVEVENNSSWSWFINLLKQDFQMDVEEAQWVLMTDQQKGLENAIAEHLPRAEHRLCVRHLHANWSKKYGGKAFKELMWEAARACSETLFNNVMEKLKNISVEAHDALARLDRHKWARCAFRKRSNCVQLVNNWAEAFNMVILKGRDQPILALLNFIHTTVMTRLLEQREEKEKWTGEICPRVDNLVRSREKLTNKYITRGCGNGKYTVTGETYTLVVDIGKMECTCGLWQLGGVPCVHAVCVYKAHNKDPRRYLHRDFWTRTFLKVYSSFLAPIRGPSDWPRSSFPPILPPLVRVLPGRPKKKRKVDPLELGWKEDNAKAKKAKATSTEYNATRNGVTMHCKLCGGEGHNKTTCGRKNGGSSSAT